MIVVFSLVAGLALVAYAWYLTGGSGAALTKVLPGGSKWDFTKSWGSNLTLVGAILGTTLSSKVFPSATVVLASPNDYISLSLLFLILVVVAPFVNNALLLRQDLSGENDLGRGWAVLAACALTLWGVIGQLGTVGLVFYEAKRAHAIAPGAVVLVWVVIGAALVLVVPYATETIAVIVKAETRRPARRRAWAIECLALYQPAAPRSSGWSVL